MLRTIWFMFLAAMIVTDCQLPVMAADVEKSDENAQQILIRSKLIDINRTKLRKLRVDYAEFLGDGVVASAKIDNAKAIDAVVQLKTINESPVAISSYFAFLEALCQNKVARILSDPTITTVVGRTNTYKCGGTIQPDNQVDGGNNSEARFFGTKIEIKPQLLGKNKIHIDYRLDYSNLRESGIAEQSGKPAIDHTVINTNFELSSGDTFFSRGILSKKQVGDQTEQHEIVLLVTAELIDEGSKLK